MKMKVLCWQTTFVTISNVLSSSGYALMVYQQARILKRTDALSSHLLKFANAGV